MTIQQSHTDVFDQPAPYASMRDVCARYAVTRKTIHEWMKTRRNGFPLSVKLGGGRNSWLKTDLLAWERSLRVEDATPREYWQPDWAKSKEASDGAR